jgi:hypothetical protein
VSEEGPAGDHWDHLERLFAEQYGREFENEENVWRSLPFFSATLAVQVAVVVQVAPLVPAVQGRLAWLVVVALVALNAVLACGVLYFLERSIRSAELSYLASEPELLAYVVDLDGYFARHGPPIDADSETPKAALQRLLVEQYAAAAKTNRAINRERARIRRRAGSLLVASVLATLLLAGVTIGPQLLWGAATGDDHGQGAPTRSGRAGVVGPVPSARGGGGADGRQAAAS